ncbi:glutathione S-transferase 2-like isoform X1 [Amaranthus tricolor]|uniref:glutathione S-transferase 2-like isoform X1 n=1 Tax=Amaranthus tricolor TaxID=29722 RepID=UPI00258A64D5|nr:glutathione S-transferase 2-like isoform X1 [Amaranthus tricolor]
MASSISESEGSGKPNLKLYSYNISSCAWRVRIALNLKGLEYEYKAVNLLKGEHLSDEFLKLNPLGYVPVLVDEDVVISDSLAIIMYLEEKYPQFPLLPRDLQKRAINYQAANIVASNIQPFQNLVVLNFIGEKLGSVEKLSWVEHHIKKGFTALEKLLAGYSGKYATGDEVYLADLFLAPQIGGAIQRFQMDMAEFPLLKRLNDAYSEVPAFQNAVPEKQPDPMTTS